MDYARYYGSGGPERSGRNSYGNQNGFQNTSFAPPPDAPYPGPQWNAPRPWAPGDVMPNNPTRRVGVRGANIPQPGGPGSQPGPTGYGGQWPGGSILRARPLDIARRPGQFRNRYRFGTPDQSQSRGWNPYRPQMPGGFPDQRQFRGGTAGYNSYQPNMSNYRLGNTGDRQYGQRVPQRVGRYQGGPYSSDGLLNQNRYR